MGIIFHPLRSASCGSGIQVRTRVCSKEQKVSPSDIDRESQPCAATKSCATCKKCPTDGFFEHENCAARGQRYFRRAGNLEECKKICRSKQLCKGFVTKGKLCKFMKTVRKKVCKRPGQTVYSKCTASELTGDLTRWSMWSKPRFGIGKKVLRDK